MAPILTVDESVAGVLEAHDGSEDTPDRTFDDASAKQNAGFGNSRMNVSRSVV